MARKKKSPITEMFEEINCRVDQIDTHHFEKRDMIKVLTAIEWNLKQVWPKHTDCYLGQAIGLVKGLRAGFGDYSNL